MNNDYFNNINNEYYNDINNNITNDIINTNNTNNTNDIININYINNKNKVRLSKSYKDYISLYKWSEKELMQTKKELTECKKELETMKEERMVCLPAAPESDNLCCICLTNEKDRAYVVCGHLCVCKECLKGEWERKCPICRTISSAIKIWK